MTDEDVSPISLKSRLAHGAVAVLDTSNGALLPAGCSHGLHPDLRHALCNWSPLSESDTWDGAYEMARSMCDGLMGRDGPESDQFWEASATALTAAALWVVRARGHGTTLVDVLDLIRGCVESDSLADTNDKDGLTSPLMAIAVEIDGFIAALDLYRARVGLTGSAMARTLPDAHNAKKTITDLADSPAITLDGTCRAAKTVLEVALRTASAGLAWDDPDAIDLDELLVDNDGTVAVIGAPWEGTFQPFIAAFLEAVGRRLDDDPHLAGRLRVVVDGRLATGGQENGWRRPAMASHVQLVCAFDRAIAPPADDWHAG